MTGYELVVRVPTVATFESYYYGYGEVRNVEYVDTGSAAYYEVTVDYGLDSYRCRYQEGRFASGLYFGEVREYESDSDLSYLT